MKKIIIIIFSLITIVLFFYFLKIRGSEEAITLLDYPTKLSVKKDTIEVTYIAWACACANWLPAHLKNTNYKDDDCIYLEADKESLIIPDEYHLGGHNNKIRLIGRYYHKKGISRTYEKPTSQKPDYAKVFRYSEIEIIKPYIIWDFTKKEPTTKKIKKRNKSLF